MERDSENYNRISTAGNNAYNSLWQRAKTKFNL